MIKKFYKIGIFSKGAGINKKFNILTTFRYSSIYHIVQKPTKDEIKHIYDHLAVQIPFKMEHNAFLELFTKQRKLVGNNQRGKTTLDLNDVSKYISFTQNAGKILSSRLIVNMLFNNKKVAASNLFNQNDEREFNLVFYYVDNKLIIKKNKQEKHFLELETYGEINEDILKKI